MDPLVKPIKSVRPSGLTIITMRTEKKGLMAGHIRMGIGAAHAAKIDPRWEGLPHFIEHMVVNGASRKYEQDEVNNLMHDKFFANHNAGTSLFETCYFRRSSSEGYVFPTHRFWAAFEATVDGVFFPKFDAPTMERERGRVLNEISERLTPLAVDNAKFFKLLYGVEHLGLSAGGTKEQVIGYTSDDCFAFHREAYTLRNTCIAMVGDVDHGQVVEKVETILVDVPSGQFEPPFLEPSKIQRGEFRRRKDDANEGHVSIILNFPAVNQSDSKYYPTVIAINALSRIIQDKVQAKYGLYSTDCYCNNNEMGSGVELYLTTHEKEKAADALAYGLEIIQDHETHALIAERHDSLVGRRVANLEVYQPTIESIATDLNDKKTIGAPLLSIDEWVQRYRNTTPDQVARIIKELNEAPAFLNVRGHPGAIGTDTVPSIDVIDTWRSLPKRGGLNLAAPPLAPKGP